MAVVDNGMRVFAYEAQTGEGQAFKGTLEGRSADEVQARLAALRLRVMSVSATADPRPRAGLPADEFMLFNQQLAHLTEAGLPVEKGLRLIAVDLRSGRLAQAASAVAAELESGVSLEQAFARHAGQFPPLYGRLMEAGAGTGNLPAMLYNLGRHLELLSRLRRALWRSLAYPLMVIAALSLVVLFISHYVLPQFYRIFDTFQTRLPALTEFMMASAKVYDPWLFLALWGLVLAVIVVHLATRNSDRPIPWVRLLEFLPLVGTVLKANLLARWIDGLRLGIEAGLDLPKAIMLSAEATGERGLIRDAAHLAQVISQGQPLIGFSGIYIPPTVPTAIQLASETGSGRDLPSVLRSLSDMYQEQAEHRLRLLPSLLTPLALAVIALAVGLTIGAMFLPLVKLIQSVSGGD